MKSSNCSMSHLVWNREITGWTASHEIVKSQHESIAVKMSECGLARFCGLDLENILGDVLLVIRAKILCIWIKDIFSMMCFWWVAPKYNFFGFRIYSRWCALDESRQNIYFLALEYIRSDVFMVSRAVFGFGIYSPWCVHGESRKRNSWW